LLRMRSRGKIFRLRKYLIKMKSTIKIGMVQINNSFSNQSYLPYSVGIFEASARKYLKNPEKFEFLSAIYSRISVDEAVSQLFGVDIVCFSTYIWNVRLSLKIAEEVKKRNSNVLIVFGGPEVPIEGVESFLRMNSFIDLACHGEGEVIFPSILENYERREWSNAAGLSYLDEAGKFVQTGLCERTSRLEKIPSPYLDGVFSRLIKENSQTQWIALWETNRGCPFSCAYCDWGSATKNIVYERNLEDLFREIDWFSENKIEFIFCCDANFGILERDIEIVEYMAKNKRKFGYPKAMSVQSTKNFTEKSYNIYRLMAASGLNKGVSLSLQSLNEETLKNIGRNNVPIQVFKKVQEELTALNIQTFTDLILGLPGETYESFADGASTAAANGQHNRIQFNNLSILTNSQMGDVDYQKKFGLDIVETKIINIHGTLNDSEDTCERQRLVVGTSAMPKDDWVKARVFGWMMSLLHFDKLLQVPFVILNKHFEIGFRDLIETFTQSGNLPPLLSEILSFFTAKAIDIQTGGVEFSESKQWLNIWWPADELMFIKLCAENKINRFYEEAEDVLAVLLEMKKIHVRGTILNETMVLNKSLIKMPHQEGSFNREFSYNIWDAYRAGLKGEELSLKTGGYWYAVDRETLRWNSWEDWCREVVWYGNKKGAYIYACKASGFEKQLRFEKI